MKRWIIGSSYDDGSAITDFESVIYPDPKGYVEDMYWIQRNPYNDHQGNPRTPEETRHILARKQEARARLQVHAKGRFH